MSAAHEQPEPNADETTAGRGAEAPVCDVEYPLVAPGRRTLQCVGARIYRHSGLPDKPWKCELRFADGFGELEIFGFFHLGTGDKPHAGRKGRYWGAWTLANGAPPRKRQTMSPRAFKGRWFVCDVETVTHKGRGAKAEPLPEHLRYSVVREILALDH
jgi:hypothetical protein